MLYIVSGYRRSGTSCMMKCLADGLQQGEVLWQEAQERIGSDKVDGYTPNPSGLWEVGQMYYMNAKFLREINNPERFPKGALLKILYDGLPNLPQGDYTIVFMERDLEEIQASCEQVDKHLRQVGVRENPDRQYTFDVFRPYNPEDIEHVLGIMEARRDVRLVRVNYRDLIEDPLGTFRKLQTTALGKPLLPIDPEQAAAVVNPELWRFRNGHEGSTAR